MTNKGSLSKPEVCIYSFIALMVGTVAGLGIIEVIARIVQPGHIQKGELRHKPDDELGWIPAKSKSTVTTSEYSAQFVFSAHPSSSN